MKRLIKKAIHRLWYCLRLKKGLYGKIGKGNYFCQGVLIDEDSIIGSHNYFGKKVDITKAIVGNYCSFAPGVVIGPGEHEYRGVSTKVSIMRAVGKPMNMTEKDITIKNDVWVGANAVLLRGITVGNGAVIAAGAIVNRDVQDYAIVGGVPAKLIKYRFDEKIRELLLQSKWYEELDHRKAAEKVKKLQEIIEI